MIFNSSENTLTGQAPEFFWGMDFRMLTLRSDEKKNYILDDHGG